uniref:LRRNT domain-containing protein n=1 Tax=Parastrongyloides trichosuri TaxID=131310 RepID=A0A0N4ZHT0_PARTI
MLLPSIIIYLLGQVILQTFASKNCPPSCTCYQNVVSCIGQSLTHVPENIPSTTVRLYINKNDFYGLENLRILHLMDNEIQVIEPHSFDNLTNLERL